MFLARYFEIQSLLDFNRTGLDGKVALFLRGPEESAQ